MNLPQVFNFNGSQVRTVLINGEPWFVAKDVCDVLEIDQVAGIRRRLSDDVITNHPIPDSLGRQQNNMIISEDGLYDVVLDSRKPEAKEFRKWITKDVIPSIRKHGTYMTPDTLQNALNNPDTMIQILTRLKDEQSARAAAEAKIEADKPLVLFAESLQISEDSILVADLAKLLKQNGIDMGEVRLFRYLRENGYLIKSGSEYNMPTQRSMEMKLMEIKMGHRGSSDGTVKITRTPKITGKGQSYFINKFLKQGDIA